MGFTMKTHEEQSSYIYDLGLLLSFWLTAATHEISQLLILILVRFETAIIEVAYYIFYFRFETAMIKVTYY
jgi:hypothetical protein